MKIKNKRNVERRLKMAKEEIEEDDDLFPEEEEEEEYEVPPAKKAKGKRTKKQLAELKARLDKEKAAEEEDEEEGDEEEEDEVPEIKPKEKDKNWIIQRIPETFRLFNPKTKEIITEALTLEELKLQLEIMTAQHVLESANK